MGSNDKSSGDPAVANDHDAEDLAAAREALKARGDKNPAEKAPDGSAPERDVDDVHRGSFVGDADQAPFTGPGGRSEGAPEQDQ